MLEQAVEQRDELIGRLVADLTSARAKVATMNNVLRNRTNGAEGEDVLPWESHYSGPWPAKVGDEELNKLKRSGA